LVWHFEILISIKKGGDRPNANGTIYTRYGKTGCSKTLLHVMPVPDQVGGGKHPENQTREWQSGAIYSFFSILFKMVRLLTSIDN
jgi:hypothetical protein